MTSSGFLGSQATAALQVMVFPAVALKLSTSAELILRTLVNIILKPGAVQWFFKVTFPFKRVIPIHNDTFNPLSGQLCGSVLI